MNFDTTVTIPSTALPGVTFTVRQLNQFERAQRDSKLIDARVRYSQIELAIGKIVDPDKESDAIRFKAFEEKRELTEAERTGIAEYEAANAIDPTVEERRMQLAKLRTQRNIEFTIGLKPGYIQAGLISIDGLESNGKPVTNADALMKVGPEADGLIDEIYMACVDGSGLTAEQIKNSQPAGTTNDQEQPSGKSTIAIVAAA